MTLVFCIVCYVTKAELDSSMPDIHAYIYSCQKNDISHYFQAINLLLNKVEIFSHKSVSGNNYVFVDCE